MELRLDVAEDTVDLTRLRRLALLDDELVQRRDTGRSSELRELRRS